MRGAYSGDGDFPPEVLAIHSAHHRQRRHAGTICLWAGRFGRADRHLRNWLLLDRSSAPARTAADYRAYKAWEMTILIVWPLGLTALFLLQREKPKGSE
jgi:hypothetical protein